MSDGIVMSGMMARVRDAILAAMDLTDSLDVMAADTYARAAIAEMREPTAGMVQAGAEPAQNSSDPAYWCWRAMIDEALTAPSSPDRQPG